MSWETYIKAFEFEHPLLENPNLDTNSEIREVLITCSCGIGVRLFVNGNSPICISEKDTVGLICPNCKELLHNTCTHLAGHSAGYFNASCRRYWE